MRTILLTLVSPERRVDLRLPAEVPLADLLPMLVERCAPRVSQATPVELSRWHVQVAASGALLDTARSLAELHVADGAILGLRDSAMPLHAPHPQRARLGQPPAAQPFRPHPIRPSAHTGGIGVRWHLPESLLAAEAQAEEQSGLPE